VGDVTAGAVGAAPAGFVAPPPAAPGAAVAQPASAGAAEGNAAEPLLAGYAALASRDVRAPAPGADLDGAPDTADGAGRAVSAAGITSAAGRAGPHAPVTGGADSTHAVGAETPPQPPPGAGPNPLAGGAARGDGRGDGADEPRRTTALGDRAASADGLPLEAGATAAAPGAERPLTAFELALPRLHPAAAASDATAATAREGGAAPLATARDSVADGAVLRNAAHLRVDAPGLGELELHLRVRDGVAHVRVDGEAARLVESRAAELSRALAGEGLKLGHVDVKPLPSPAGGGAGDATSRQHHGSGRHRDEPPPPPSGAPPAPPRRAGSAAPPPSTGRFAVRA
jgi:hypothetical protein